MAIAPVNKFISVLVPVAPGEQELYEVPTGTSALLLYAQVANVGIGTTYPTVTFIQRRETRSTGNTRDVRVIKDVEIPPNDALILIDGRMVLEKTALVSDKLIITGTQTGITTINNVLYDEPTGIVTVSTMSAHGFSAGDQITMAGIAFTCDSSAGITTNIFPDPQKSYVIDTVPDTKSFTAAVGGSKGYKHVYNPTPHRYVRSRENSVTVTGTGNQFTPTDGSYDPLSGIATFHICDHGMMTVDGSYQPTSAAYNGDTGVLTITLSGHAFTDGSLVKFDDDALSFKCDMDSAPQNVKTYPRKDIDPASGTWLKTTYIDAANFSVNVGASPKQYFDVSAADYDPASGIATLTIGRHNFSAGITSIRLSPKSLTFSCTHGGGGISTYPRPSGYLSAPANDPSYNLPVAIAATTTTTISIDVLKDVSATNTSPHTFIPNPGLTPIDSNGSDSTAYNASTGVLTLAFQDEHGMENGDAIKIADNGLTFSCGYCGAVGINSQKTYPRANDPAGGNWLPITVTGTKKFTVNVGNAGDASGETHYFESAVANCVTRSVVIGGGNYTHSFVSAVAGSMKKSTNTVTVSNNSQIFTCSMDNNKTEHSYPRSTDRIAGIATPIVEADDSNIAVYAGITTAGGFVGPLQMEFMASILENSNA